MLMRFDPFRELDRLARSGLVDGNRSPVVPIDAYRHGDRLVVHFDLPGIDPDRIDLTVQKNVLKVTAERSWSREGQDVLVSERPQGTFSRQLFLGDALDADHIEASYAQGVLTVSVPVAEQAKPRKVEITAGGNPMKAIEGTAA